MVSNGCLMRNCYIRHAKMRAATWRELLPLRCGKIVFLLLIIPVADSDKDTMNIGSVYTSMTTFPDLLKLTSGTPANLVRKLLQLSAQNTVDVQKMQTIANVIDTYA